MAIKQPPLITYNLKDRGRTHRGQERNFNIKALCDSINSPATQEMVNTRAMVGYYGHSPRVLSKSLAAVESFVVNGKYNEVEPAVVTTSLKAYPDGRVEHQTEFLDSVPGRKAARMFASRVGGFSSAIDAGKHEMFGFDYVLDPNYSTNRGFSLDSTDLTLDQVQDEVKSEEDAFTQRLLDLKDEQLDSVTAAFESLQAENEELLSMLAKAGIEQTTFDSVKPVLVSLDSVNQMQEDKRYFNAEAKLPGFVGALKESTKDDEKYDSIVAMIGHK